MSTVTKSFTATGTSDQLSLKPGEAAEYSVTGTFTGSVVLEKSTSPTANWKTQDGGIAATGFSGSITNESKGTEWYRFRSTVASGTAVASLSDTPTTAVKHITNAAGQAKAGATAGFVVAEGDDIGLVTCPASKTAATLVVPITGLKVGEVITGFHLIGQIESGGNHVTVDADLRKHTAAAADVADASVGAITQLDVTADTIMSALNTRKAALSHTVAADETFYVLITVTTGVATDIALQGVAIESTEV
jgi:hypothetical protein